MTIFPCKYWWILTNTEEILTGSAWGDYKLCFQLTHTTRLEETWLDFNFLHLYKVSCLMFDVYMRFHISCFMMILIQHHHGPVQWGLTVSSLQFCHIYEASLATLRSRALTIKKSSHWSCKVFLSILCCQQAFIVKQNFFHIFCSLICFIFLLICNCWFSFKWFLNISWESRLWIRREQPKKVAENWKEPNFWKNLFLLHNWRWGYIWIKFSP